MYKRFKTNVVLIFTLVVIIGMLSGCNKVTKSNAEVEEETYIPVEVEKASIQTIANNIKFNGKVLANEEIAVLPKVSGTVSSVNVKLGDVVKEGSILFVVEQDTILKNVEQAANAIEIANNGVVQSESSLKVAKANYELNKERIENAKLNLERNRELYEEGIISKSQLEQAELAASDMNLEAAAGQLEQAETMYQQAVSQLKQAQISYDQMEDNLNNTVVKAPMDGVVSALNVKEGQIVGSGQMAATIVDMDKVYMEINVVEDVVNRLSIGQKADVIIPAAFDEDITSTISYISPTADIGSNLYSIKLYVDNPDKKIKPGMNGKVKLNLDEIQSVIAIKSDAVLDKDDEKIVFVVEDDHAVEKTVILGLDTGEYAEIKEGLKTDEQVIVKGQHYVENGRKVKVVEGE
ncbi:efflux RND transporter periplasmic adaptor subunit [Tissierella praeacuta]|uniref:efflux RND transporter periplasmic adaptor subunit n=1 Tax=Tissierella praeacuta TaxID=43131 RepID=UPI0033412D15